VTACHFMQLLCNRGGHPAGNHQRGAAADATRNFQCGCDFFRGQRDDGQVGSRLRQIGQRAGGVNVDEGQAALELLRLQRRHEGLCLLGQAVRLIELASEDHNRFRREQGVEVVLFHGGGCRPS